MPMIRECSSSVSVPSTDMNPSDDEVELQELEEEEDEEDEDGDDSESDECVSLMSESGESRAILEM